MTRRPPMPSRLAILFRFTSAVLALTFTFTAMPAQAADPFSAVTLEPGETVRVLTLEQWRAVQHFAPERQQAMARIAWCESKFDADAVGDGGRSLGAWQVQPQFWGAVPATLEEQAQQAERIAAEHGTDPWTTRDGCEGWSR